MNLEIKINEALHDAWSNVEDCPSDCPMRVGDGNLCDEETYDKCYFAWCQRELLKRLKKEGAGDGE